MKLGRVPSELLAMPWFLLWLLSCLLSICSPGCDSFFSLQGHSHIPFRWNDLAIPEWPEVLEASSKDLDRWWLLTYHMFYRTWLGRIWKIVEAWSGEQQFRRLNWGPKSLVPMLNIWKLRNLISQSCLLDGFSCRWDASWRRYLIVSIYAT